MRTTLALVVVSSVALGAGKDPGKRPAVLLVLPAGVVPGSTATLTLRGRGLDTARAVRLSPAGASARLVRQGKAAPPAGADAAVVGDTEAVVELRVPADPPRDPWALLVETPAGETDLVPLRVDRVPPTPEREPNPGFRGAQALAPGATVDGVIGAPQDVDVYRLDGRAGDRLALAVSAARRGSALTPLLSLFDAGGHLMAQADATSGGGDPRLDVTLPAAGASYAVVTDAHDRGSPLHVYRLTLDLTRPVSCPGP